MDTLKKKLLIGCSLVPLLSAAAEKKPNVILFFVDDFGYGDLGCYGNKIHRTPHIDEMAKQGMRLTDFCVGSSLSSPSRSAILTGSYPRRVSMHINADPKPLMSGGKQVLFPVSTKGLNPEEITIAELLKKEGYATACIGKWHLGDQLPFLPTRQGFDYYFGIPYSNDMNRDFCPLPLMEQEEVIEAPVNQDSLTYRYTQKAIDYIKEHKDAPFFIHLCHNMTHDPLAASPNFRGKSQNGLYGDATEELDWSMGEILKTLKDLDLEDNTLVIFTSDNGAERGFGGSNLPLRGLKGTVYEGGYRVPCIWYWPGKIPAGTESDELVTAMDLLPTLGVYCGYETPTDRVIDGHDVTGIVEGKGMKSPTPVFYYYQRHQLQAIRWGDWKYHLPLKNHIKYHWLADVDTCEAALYNLKEDVAETKNVLDEHPEIVKNMERLIDEVRNDMGDAGYEGQNQRPAGFIDEPFPRVLRE